MRYEAELIKLAYYNNYEINKAISEYTSLEIKYSPKENIFNISDEVRQKAFNEMQDKILRCYNETTNI